MKSASRIMIRHSIWVACTRVFFVLLIAACGRKEDVEGADNAPEHRQALSSFERLIMRPVGSNAAGSTEPEAPLELRLFAGPVKTNSRGEIITGSSNDPIKNLVGAESAGDRGGMTRFTKILFGVKYDNGRPDPGTRLNPNSPSTSKGSHHWPFVKQPFRSWPTAVATTPTGNKLYVTLPGREGYPDWRVAAVDTAQRRVLKWIDLRPAGKTQGTRPMGIAVAPAGTFAVVLNQYANFASVIDTATDTVLGEFETGFYGEKPLFSSDGQRLYITVRNGFSIGKRGLVRVFGVASGPTFTPIADIPVGTNELEQANPRDLTLSSDGKTLYVSNTLGNRIAVIDTTTNTLVTTMPLGGLGTDVKIAGRWGIVSGHETNNCLNQPETGHGMPKKVGGTFVKNNGQPLGYLPVMSDCTKATTFDDIGTELNIFDTTTNRFVFRYVDGANGRSFGRNDSLLVTAGQHVDLQDFTASQMIIKGSGAEQIFVNNDLLFVSHLHSEKVEVFRINQNPTAPSKILTELDIQFTGGITPQGVVASPDGKMIFVAHMQTEDVAFMRVGVDGKLTRVALLPVGVTGNTPDPTTGGNGKGLFATAEERGLRWLFSDAYSDDGQKSCGFCHWQSRHDGGQWNVGGNAVGGPKVSPQNKDISDNWPEWFEGLMSNMTAYASSCNGELIVAERPTALFPQLQLADRLKARDEFVREKTAANSKAIGRSDLSGSAFSTDYYDMAFDQILWSQNETRRMPNPLSQFPTDSQRTKISRGKFLFTAEVAQGGSGCASCHQNGSAAVGPRVVDGVVNSTFQDFSIHEPGVVAETTVGGDGVFLRLENDYFFEPFGQLEDVGSRQNIGSRNTKHLRSFWDSVPRWLHHGSAHTIREILLAPDSALLKPNERGFNFRTVRTDSSRRVAHDFRGGPSIVLPTEVPITLADKSGGFAGDAKGPIYVSLDAPTPVPGSDGAGERFAYPQGRLLVDQLGTANLAPLVVFSGGTRQINPALSANNIAVIKDTHGQTSHLTSTDLDALDLYLRSLQ